MGQRSQIYVRFANKDNEPPTLIAKYYGWNFGERMISRARYGITCILDKVGEYKDFYLLRYNEGRQFSLQTTDIEKINRIFDVNFDMIDVALSQNILNEYIEQFADSNYANHEIFITQDNNDGKLFVDVTNDGTVKYCFTDYDLNILSPEQYMDWDYKGWKENKYLSADDVGKCEENINFLNENAVLMTKEELQEFINYDYSQQLLNIANKLGININPEMLHCNVDFDTLLPVKQPKFNLDEPDICDD